MAVLLAKSGKLKEGKGFNLAKVVLIPTYIPLFGERVGSRRGGRAKVWRRCCNLSLSDLCLSLLKYVGSFTLALAPSESCEKSLLQP